MSESQQINNRGRRDWLKTALQPAMLLYVLTIPALWTAIAAVLTLQQNRAIEGVAAGSART